MTTAISTEDPYGPFRLTMTAYGDGEASSADLVAAAVAAGPQVVEVLTTMCRECFCLPGQCWAKGTR